jgi:diguanylate cyclase (GGDEF)-like protein
VQVPETTNASTASDEWSPDPTSGPAAASGPAVGSRPGLPDGTGLVALFATYAVAFLWINHAAGGSAVVRAITYEGFAVPIALGCAVAAVRARVARLPRALLAAGVVVAMAADLAWDLDAVGRLSLSDMPVVSALMYLPAYLLLFGTVIAIGARWGDGSAAATLETVIVAAGAAIAGYPYLISPYVDTSQTQGQVALGIVAPVGDILVLCGLVLLIPRLRAWRVIWLLTVGMLAWLVADHSYRLQLLSESYSPGGWVDLLWLAWYTSLALAMRQSGWPTAERTERTERMPRTSFFAVVTLGAAALAAPAWSIYAQQHFDAARTHEVLLPLTAATVVVVTLVMIRLALLLQAHTTTTARLNVTVTERQELADSLQHQALHDTLTGLPNRSHLTMAAGRVDPARGAAVAFIDLDDFKNVNDTLGHEAGDSLLCAVAERLRSHTRSGDLVARLGGDEFAILMPGLSPRDARRRIEHILEAISAPVDIDGHRVNVSASIGVSPLTADYDGALAAADMAMYAVKKGGKGRVRVYDQSMTAQVLGDASLAADLRKAIEDDDLTLAYQPVVSLRTGEVVGCEALLRWTHPTLGLLPPSTFLGVAEQRGMAVDLDRWVTGATVRQIAAWRAAGFMMRVNVNASAAFIAEPSFVDDVLNALASQGVPGDLLTIEVTEQSLLADLTGAATKLKQLRELGVRVALDDFGTGYSGLAYLQELPVDVLKLDRGFVRVDEAGVPDGPLLGVVVGLGHALGMRVVAEGVESTLQEETLRALGCDEAQGWRWTEALDPAALQQWAGRNDDRVTVASHRR